MSYDSQDNIGTTEEYQEDSNYSEYMSTGTPNEDPNTILRQLFSTNDRIEILRRCLRGETPKGDGTWIKLPKELAGDIFVNKQISSIRAIINDTNTFTRKTDSECKRILKDSVEAFLRDAHDDETVDTRDARTLSKIYEHALELFLGLVEFGHGAKVLASALHGHKLENDKTKEKTRSFMNWLESN